MLQMESKYFYCFSIVLLLFLTHTFIHSHGLQETTGKTIIQAQLKDNSLKCHFFFDVVCLSWPSCSPNCLLLLLSQNSIAISVFKHFLGLLFTKVTDFICLTHNLEDRLLLSITPGFLIIICKHYGNCVWSSCFILLFICLGKTLCCRCNQRKFRITLEQLFLQMREQLFCCQWEFYT